ncbi:hypothetical protein AAGQ24_26270, partial [Klebsiella pneumoniae]
GPDPRNFNQRVSLGRNDLLIRTFPRGAERIPVIIQENADVIVGWNSNSIVNNIISAIENSSV